MKVLKSVAKAGMLTGLSSSLLCVLYGMIEFTLMLTKKIPAVYPPAWSLIWQISSLLCLILFGAAYILLLGGEEC